MPLLIMEKMEEKVEICCGSCQKFLYEDTDGMGICDITGKPAYCGDGEKCENYTQEHPDSNLHCSQCIFWNMGFDNTCTERIRRFEDFSNQDPDQRACISFEKEEV